MIFTIVNREIECDESWLIGNNADYKAEFEFDSEWDGLTKTARFQMNKSYVDVIINDNTCIIPEEILKKGILKVGVYSDDKSTTFCELNVKASIKEYMGIVQKPMEDVYEQLIEKLDALYTDGLPAEQIRLKVEEYFTTHPDMFKDDVETILNDYLVEQNIPTDIAQAQKDIVKFEHESAGAIIVPASGSVVSANDASDKGLHHITLFGKSTQAITTGAQLYDVNDLKQGLALGYSIDADDWIYYEGDNTKGTSEMYVNCVTNVSELIEVGKTYKLVVEVAMLLGNGSITACSNTTGITNTSQFKTNVVVSKIGTHVFDLVARDSFEESTSMLRNFVTTKTGCRIKAKFRISVLPYDETLTAETFVYEKFTGGVAQSVSIDTPIEIESVGDDGNVSVRVVNEENSQSTSIDLSEPLRGLSVDSGGNYTDADGQQWIADTLEVFADGTGKLTQRVSFKTITKITGTDATTGMLFTSEPYIDLNTDVKQNVVMSDKYVARTLEGSRANDYGISSYAKIIYIRNKDYATVDDFNAHVAENPIKLLFVLKTPIVTELTAEQVQAFVALHSYKPNTVITTDDMGDISVEYIADSKTYIDNKFDELSKAIVALAE